MKITRRLSPLRRGVPGAVLAAAVAGLPLAAPALALAGPTASSDVAVLAQQPQSYSQAMVDNAGVLSPEEIAEINQAIEQYQIDHQRSLMIVFQESFEGMDAQEFAQRTLQANGSNNLVVLVVATGDHQYYVQGGRDWTESEAKDLDKAVRPHLVQQQWAEAARAFVEEAQSSGQISGESVAWLGGATVTAVGAGGGLWWWSRKRRKRDEDERLEQAAQISPEDTDSLMDLPVDTLERLAREAVVSTDESVRRGEEEVKLALAEFGEQRSRPFVEALRDARRAMDSAHQAQHRLGLGGQGSTAAQKSLLVETISACSKAQRALDEQAERFAENRALLLNTEGHLAELTRKTVDVRARIPGAQKALEALGAEHSEAALTSVSQNVELAEASVSAAEKQIDTARAAADRPAGQQAEAVGAIREAEHALKVADRMLDAIDHADDDIAAARADLPALIEEISQEARTARELAQRGWKSGALDGRDLTALAEEAEKAVSQTRTTAKTDPLTVYQELTELDGRLDEALEKAGQATANQERLIRIYQQQLSTARAAVQAADDLIASRGRTIGPAARNELATANQELRLAEQEGGDLRQQAEHARQATQHANRAAKLARRDFDNYRRRNNQGGNGGAFLAGMLVNGILSGGGRGGFGGGFGGGGFGGGGGGFGGGSGGRF